MSLDLGYLVPALKGWLSCVGECRSECAVCINLPKWFEELPDKERTYLLLYVAARATMDYRVAAAMHIYSVREHVALYPELLVKVVREAEAWSRTRAVEDVHPCCWEAVLYKGIIYAQTLMNLDKPVIVRVKPPSGKHAREKLRVMLEGKRVTVKGKTYHVGGLVRKLGGEKLSPWLYLIPSKQLPKLWESIKSSASFETIHTA